MPDPTLQEQPKISLKNLLGSHASNTIFSPSSLAPTHLHVFRSLQKLSFNMIKAYFKRKARNDASSFLESELAIFSEEGMRKLAARWEDVMNKRVTMLNSK
ncbi:unnamed protein product [Hymenolepis diminuta]|uniref:Uncharacterized protein n=1 Tax=Hymenolepis diminuta TaxID=6216 RepID=A0A564YRC4_HYMDI|nr:unnamed protein product [Hymenolepis diminuta]